MSGWKETAQGIKTVAGGIPGYEIHRTSDCSKDFVVTVCNSLKELMKNC